MRNMIVKTHLCRLFLFTLFFMSCSHDITSLKITNSLPVEKVARYNDSFDSMRADMWDKIGFIRGASVRTDFRQADVSIESGRLKVETKTGCFSSGGISSKFYFRGDFDVQVECDVNFLKHINSMDQLIYFLAADITTELEDSKLENVFLQLDKEGMGQTYITGASIKQGKRDRCYVKKIDDYFKGAFRIVRIGNQITLLYSTNPGGEWQKACSFSRSSNDTRINLGVRNFFERRVSIDARSPFTVQFDNFRVNAAQKIIESEI